MAVFDNRECEKVRVRKKKGEMKVRRLKGIKIRRRKSRRCKVRKNESDVKRWKKSRKV